VIVQEPNPADEPAAIADVDEPAVEDGDADPERDDPLAPGDSDLADAWWAL
jgi:hypothetical protein